MMKSKQERRLSYCNLTNMKIATLSNCRLFNNNSGTTDAVNSLDQYSVSKNSLSSIKNKFSAFLQIQQFVVKHSPCPSAHRRRRSNKFSGPPVREVICYHSPKKTPSSRSVRRSSTNSDKRRPSSLKRGSLVYLDDDLNEDETWSVTEEYSEEEGPHLLGSTTYEDSLVFDSFGATEKSHKNSELDFFYFHRDPYRRFSNKGRFS